MKENFVDRARQQPEELSAILATLHPSQHFHQGHKPPREGVRKNALQGCAAKIQPRQGSYDHP